MLSVLVFLIPSFRDDTRPVLPRRTSKFPISISLSRSYWPFTSYRGIVLKKSII